MYLAVPLIAFGVRFAGASDRGFGVPGLFPAFEVSVVTSTISLAIVTVFGIPLAYLLARSRGGLTTAVTVLVQLPLALPPVMAGILLIFVVGPYTALGRLFGGDLTQSLAGIVIAQTFVSAPFLIIAARSSFAAMDPALLDVAATLGRSELARSRLVALPIAAPGIGAGMVLTWLRAFGEYGANVVLAYNPSSLPVYTYNRFSAGGLPQTLAPTALALGVAALAVVIGHAFGRLARSRRHRPAVLPGPRRPTPVAAAPVGFDVDYRVGSFHLSVAYHRRGTRLAILGPSGSGKSTLLRCLAGLAGPAAGTVWYGSRCVTEVPVENRRVGYVAQGFGLFPHLTVWQQLVFGNGTDPAVAAYWLTHLRLDGLQDRLPHQLSGGQRQRVAVGQALAGSPDLLLLDEPFSALDTPVSRQLQRELRQLQHETGISTVLVTHDPEEAALLADEIIVVARGVALQDGPTRQVFTRPASPEAALLLGVDNLGRATVTSPGWIDAAGVLVAGDTGALTPGASVLWSVRPERIRLQPVDGSAPDPTVLAGTLVDVADLGMAVDVVVALAPGLELRCRILDGCGLSAGQRCRVGIPPEAVILWPATELAPSADLPATRQHPLGGERGAPVGTRCRRRPGPVATAPVPDEELDAGVGCLDHGLSYQAPGPDRQLPPG